MKYYTLYKKDPNIDNDAFFKFRIIIDEDDFILTFKWNTRAERWHMDIYDATEEPILTGIPLTVESNLIGRFKNNKLPNGILILRDTSNENVECGFNDFGDRCLLVYATE